MTAAHSEEIALRQPDSIALQGSRPPLRAQSSMTRPDMEDAAKLRDLTRFYAILDRLERTGHPALRTGRPVEVLERVEREARRSD